MQIITPNPLDDFIVRQAISTIHSDMFSEMKKYKGQLPTRQELNTTEKRLTAILSSGLFTIGQQSLLEGCKEVGVSLPPLLLSTLHNDCRQRAIFSANSITNTTALAFGVMYAALKKKTAIGKKRSKSNATYEGNRIFLEQRTKAWRLKAGVLKAWYVQSDNPCPICEDNEDDGRIPIDQPFTSGDIAPPGHYGCLCLMSLIL